MAGTHLLSLKDFNLSLERLLLLVITRTIRLARNLILLQTPIESYVRSNRELAVTEHVV